MINELDIKNFQSLKSVHLTLGRFTAIIGPSSSGKTAVMRAFRALASNIRGSDYVTRGQTVASISATMDGWKVTLERGAGHGVYNILNTQTGEEFKFTKLGGAVPEQVTAVLGVKPVSEGGSLNFAGQFDKPFLVDDAGSQSAKVIGELTNISTIFNAVGNANKIRQRFSTQLKTREDDLVSVEEQLSHFDDLDEQELICQRLEDLLTQVVKLNTEIEQLSQLLSLIEGYRTSIENIVIPVFPDFTAVDSVARDVLNLKSVLESIEVNNSKNIQLKQKLAELDNMQQSIHNQMHQMLIDAGECPTCGQKVT